MSFRIVVLGGYGHFGARIARRLAQDAGMEVTVVGRDPARAVETASAIALECGRRVDAAAFDVTARDVGAHLRSLEPNLVIHTCGPFQARDHGVARAALSVGAHYVDLGEEVPERGATSHADGFLGAIGNVRVINGNVESE